MSIEKSTGAHSRGARKPRTRSEQREATRERIVAAALEAFAEKGFHGASTRDIAERIDTHLKPRYEQFMRLRGIRFAGFDEASLPHAWYMMAGAASLIFAVAPECRRLTGLDPETERAVEAHAEFVARLLVP